MARNLIKKVCLLGDGEVGKTSLIRKFVYDDFDDRYLMTIGTKITKKTLTLDAGSEMINLTIMLNDIVGQVEFERIHSQYYRGSAAGIFVCDLTRRATLQRMDWWMESFRRTVGDVPIILLANKSDLEEKRQVSSGDLTEYAVRYACPSFETSAKNGMNVETAFRTVGGLLCNRK